MAKSYLREDHLKGGRSTFASVRAQQEYLVGVEELVRERKANLRKAIFR